MLTRTRLALGLLVAAAFAGVSHLGASAAGGACTAHVGGVDVGKKVLPELVLFNTTGTSYNLDLVIRNAAGDELVNRAGGITVDRFQTVAVDIETELLAAVAAKKPKIADGVVSISVTGDGGFGPDTVLVHVTTYVATKRNKPKAAFVLPASYVTNDT